MIHIFSNYIFKLTEKVACCNGNRNNDDVTKISKIPNFVKMDYDNKYITGYVLGNWKDTENVIQQY